MSQQLNKLRALVPEYADVPDEELIPILHKEYMPDFPIQKMYDKVGVKNPEADGEFIRGLKEQVPIIKQAGYGALSGIGALGETAFGQGGIASGIRKAGEAGYLEKQKELQETARPSDEWDYAKQKGIEGDWSHMGDFLTHSLGAGFGQLGIAAVTGGAGGLLGKAVAKSAFTNMMERATAAQTEKLLAENATKLGAEKLTEKEAARLAGDIVANKVEKYAGTAAIGALATGQEAGEIGGTVTSEHAGEVITPKQHGLALGMGAVAGGLEGLGEVLGIKAITGGLPFGKALNKMTGMTGRVARGGVGALEASPIEYGTEYLQTLAELKGEGKDPFTPEALNQANNAGMQGGVGGFGIGFSGGLLSKAKNVDEAIDGANADLNSPTDTPIVPPTITSAGPTERQPENTGALAGVALPLAQQDFLATHVTPDGKYIREVDRNQFVDENFNPVTIKNRNNLTEVNVRSSRIPEADTNNIAWQEQRELEKQERLAEQNNDRTITTEANTGIITELNPIDAESNKVTGEGNQGAVENNQSAIEPATGELTNDSVSNEKQSSSIDIPIQQESAARSSDKENNSGFIPTHELNDGTPVKHLDGNIYIDKDDFEWQSDDAIKLPSTENKTEPATKVQIRKPNPREKSIAPGADFSVDLNNYSYTFIPHLNEVHVTPKGIGDYETSDQEGIVRSSSKGDTRRNVWNDKTPNAWPKAIPDQIKNALIKYSDATNKEEEIIARKNFLSIINSIINKNTALQNVKNPIEKPPNKKINDQSSQVANETPKEEIKKEESILTVKRQGHIGIKLEAGESVLTSSGRETSAFPKFKTATGNIKPVHIKAVNKWLMKNALDEAKHRGDEFNARQFEANIEKPSQANKDAAEEYLFGEQPRVEKIIDKQKEILEERFKNNLETLSLTGENLFKDPYIKHNKDIIALAEKRGDIEFANKLKELQSNTKGKENDNAPMFDMDASLEDFAKFQKEYKDYFDPAKFPSGNKERTQLELSDMADDIDKEIDKKENELEKNGVSFENQKKDIELNNLYFKRNRLHNEAMYNTYKGIRKTILNVVKNHVSDYRNSDIPSGLDSRENGGLIDDDFIDLIISREYGLLHDLGASTASILSNNIGNKNVIKRVSEIIARKKLAKESPIADFDMVMNSNLSAWSNDKKKEFIKESEDIAHNIDEGIKDYLIKISTQENNNKKIEIKQPSNTQTTKSVENTPESTSKASTNHANLAVPESTQKKEYHPAIESYANDLTEGGNEQKYIYDEHGKITGRPPSLNPEWFKDGKFHIYKPDGELYASAPSVREVKLAVSDYKAGKKLRPKQIAILESLHDLATEDEELGSHKSDNELTHDQEIIADHLESLINNDTLTLDEINRALKEFDNLIPFGTSESTISLNDFEKWMGITNEKERPAQSTIAPKEEILQGYTESELAKREREQAERDRKESEAELKAKQKAEADKGIDSLADEMLGTYGTNDLFGGNPLADLGRAENPVEILDNKDVLSKEKIISSYQHRSMGGVNNKVEMERAWHEKAVQAFQDKLEPLARSEQQKELVKKLVNQFRKDYVTKRYDVLKAGEGVVSSFVAGKSNFNYKQSEKRSNSLDKAEDNFNAWLDKEQSLAEYEIQKIRTPEDKKADNNKVELLKVKKLVKPVTDDLAMIALYQATH